MAERRSELTVGEVGLLAAAAGALGLAVQLRDGTYDPAALGLVALALVAAVAAILGYAPRLGERAVATLMFALIVGQLGLLLVQPIAIDLAPGPAGALPLLLLVAAALALLALFAVSPRWLRRLRWPAIGLLVGVHFALGLWIIGHVPAVGDVFLFQRDALRALFRGVDPYRLTYRNIYHPYEGFYGPGLVVNGRLQFGYPYPPLSLLLVAPAGLIGDFRYAHLAALSLSGGLLAAARPGRLGPLAAGLLLFSPRVGLMLQMGWTEPLLILLLATTTICARRYPRLLPVAFGLLLACKQYLVLLLAAAALLIPRRAGAGTVESPSWLRQTLRLAGIAIGVAAALTLPLALWDVRAFVRSAVTLQFVQPFREDALSFLAPIAAHTGLRLTWLPAVLGPAALLLAVKRCPRTPAGFALAVAFVFLVFFSFNKQAFCNYYYFPLGALCTAIATAEVDPPTGVPS